MYGLDEGGSSRNLNGAQKRSNVRIYSFISVTK